jgi:haloacetate dehalogenase
MFQGFARGRVAVAGAEIAYVTGGGGPPLLFLHGYPQTKAIWDRVAAGLVADFTVVAADLRGYGESGKPRGGPDHAAYAKRTMAADQVALMAALGHRRFHLVGHDRGGRVAHRLALDHPDRVDRVAVLDIVPTRTLYRATNRAIATAYFHWFFLIQPYDLPERLIGADPDRWLDHAFGRWGAGDQMRPGAVAEYRRCFRDPAAIHASCEDYRAAASIDLEHDEADLDRRVTAPLLALWGARGMVGREFDVLGAWRERAEQVAGEGLDCGHYLPEERPAETEAALRRFLRA